MTWRRRRYWTWIVGGVAAIAAGVIGGPIISGNDTPSGTANIGAYEFQP